jgi:hypothetical protein
VLASPGLRLRFQPGGLIGRRVEPTPIDGTLTARCYFSRN